MAVFIHFARLVKKGDRERFLGRGGVSTRKQERYRGNGSCFASELDG